MVPTRPTSNRIQAALRLLEPRLWSLYHLMLRGFYYSFCLFNKRQNRDLLGSPGVKTLHFQSKDASSPLVNELRSHMLQGYLCHNWRET